MTMCDQHLTEIYSALLLQINKEHIDLCLVVRDCNGKRLIGNWLRCLKHSLTVIQSHLSANHNKERVNDIK